MNQSTSMSALARGYLCGSCVSDKNGYAKVSLHYATADEAEAAINAIADAVDASLRDSVSGVQKPHENAPESAPQGLLVRAARLATIWLRPTELQRLALGLDRCRAGQAQEPDFREEAVLFQASNLLRNLASALDFAADVQDAKRYRFIRDVPYSENIRLIMRDQSSAIMDAAIDDALMLKANGRDEE